MERKQINKYLYNRLPPMLQDLTDSFDNREKDIVLLSSIGVLSNCLPNIRAYYDGDVVYTHLYILIVAPPASGKGVMNYARILIEGIHDKIVSDSKTEMLLCEEGKKGKNENKKQPCSNLKVKILPANISTAEMYSFLGSSEHGLLIMESEADTLSNMLSNDWSNYSDVLRKAFHNEPLSIARKMEKIFEDIKSPKLAMVVSGTPDQLKPLIKSKDNGLFSRFIVYNFDEISNFKDVFALNSKNNRVEFEKVSQRIFQLYGKLSELEVPIEFEFSISQQKKFLKRFRFIRQDIIDTHSQSFLANLHRHGLIMYRICMILTVLRSEDELLEKEKITCNNYDFVLALRLMEILLRHSQFTFDTIESGHLSSQDEEILDSMGVSFSREQIVAEGEKKKIPIRTIDDKLSQWQRKKIIKKINRGNYKKL